VVLAGVPFAGLILGLGGTVLGAAGGLSLMFGTGLLPCSARVSSAVKTAEWPSSLIRGAG